MRLKVIRRFQVNEIGALTPEIQMNVDVNKMAAAQIGFSDITQAIGNENILASAGTIKTDGVRRALILSRILKMPTK
jgi:multidrug efflux pump